MCQFVVKEALTDWFLGGGLTNMEPLAAKQRFWRSCFGGGDDEISQLEAKDEIK